VKRGEVVTVALQGDFGKPRPAVVVQSDHFNPTHSSITVLPLTTDLVSAPTFRVTVEPTERNGLRALSQVMVDKLISVRRERIGRPMGRLDDATMTRLNRSMAVWLGIA
jgi:mRNA interferase MazF